MTTMDCAGVDNIEPTEDGAMLIEHVSTTVETEPSPSICTLPALLIQQHLEEEKRDPNTGTKLSPICQDTDMKRQSTPLEELQRLCFPESFSLMGAQWEAPPGVTTASFYSHSSDSVSTQQHSNSSNGSLANNGNGCILTHLTKKSAEINSAVVERTTSRHGRSDQRWIVDSQSGKVTRLVAGCVPILRDGRILLVSSSKKKEWIVPKGGWEIDEEVEESAIRETFEEGGVTGVLGIKLSHYTYETRKAREKRLALEEQTNKDQMETEGQFCSGWSDVSQLSEDDHILTPDKRELSNDTKTHQTGMSPESVTKPKVEVVTVQSLDLDEGLELPQQTTDRAFQNEDQQASTETHTSGKDLVYSHVWVHMFPLYVQHVMAEWPENGRLRKAVDIEEAIELLAGRPELQVMLLEVKAKGLHRVD